MRQKLYHLVQKVVSPKFSETMEAVFSKASQTSSKNLSGQKLIRETRQSWREAESQLKDAEKLSSERENALQESERSESKTQPNASKD